MNLEVIQTLRDSKNLCDSARWRAAKVAKATKPEVPAVKRGTYSFISPREGK